MEFKTPPNSLVWILFFFFFPTYSVETPPPFSTRWIHTFSKTLRNPISVPFVSPFTNKLFLFMGCIQIMGFFVTIITMNLKPREKMKRRKEDWLERLGENGTEGRRYPFIQTKSNPNKKKQKKKQKKEWIYLPFFITPAFFITPSITSSDRHSLHTFFSSQPTCFS